MSFPLGVARRHDPVKAYVTIIEGCNEFCSFCVVPYTRGSERMRPKRDILDEVIQAAGEGHREIQLLGQIVNHYQAPDDPSCDFAALLEAVHEVPGVERIRFASPHPRHVPMRLIEAVRDLPKVCKHFHLPVQSGSTRVLAAMRRRYTRESYLELVAMLRDMVPGITLTTDMIVGFPGRDRRRFRRHDEPDARRPLREHVLVQVLAAAEYARAEALSGRCDASGEDAADRRAAGAAARDSDRAARSGSRLDASTCWSIR